MKYLLILLSATLLLPSAHAGITKASLLSAMAGNLVQVSALKGEGSYNAKGLSLKIENRSRQTLELSIDPALIFQPEDTSYQDLVIAGNERTTIAPGASRTLTIQSYCGKSDARAPFKGLAFRYQRQGDSNMIRVMDYMRKNGISNDVAQQAVWVLTNKHALSSVYSPEQDEASRKLVAFMAGLLGKELPSYYKLYDIDTRPGQPVLRPKALKIFAHFRWELKEQQELTLAVYDQSGKQVDRMFENRLFKKGGYELTARFESAHVTAGDYYIRLMAGATLLQETKVQVD